MGQYPSNHTRLVGYLAGLGLLLFG